MSSDEKINLKLAGRNLDDLKVISAYLQDSITEVKDIVFLKQNKIFVMIVNRFMWEDVERGFFRKNKRIRCAIKFEGINKIISKNINQKKKNKILECLAIHSNLNERDKIYETKIFFSGGSIITMFSETIDLAMHDLGNPWDVKFVPKHNI